MQNDGIRNPINRHFLCTFFKKIQLKYAKGQVCTFFKNAWGWSAVMFPLPTPYPLIPGCLPDERMRDKDRCWYNVQMVRSTSAMC